MHITNASLTSQAQTATLSYEKESLSVSLASVSPTVESLGETTETLDAINALEPKYRMLVLLLERLTGQKINLGQFKTTSTSASSTASGTASSAILTYNHVQEEASALSMNISGSVQTEEGKAMEFSLSIQWNQHFYEEQSIRIQDGKILQDPLVISMDGGQALSSDAFAFNLTGKEGESIPFMNGTAGYLARDINDDGKIQSGQELFGPKSGDGFKELKQFDDDKNGWIDESDSIFKQLKLWQITTQGESLISLKEAGIGALSLNSVELGYTAKSSIDSTLGYYKQGSVALSEEGLAYGLFSVDIAV